MMRYISKFFDNDRINLCLGTDSIGANKFDSMLVSRAIALGVTMFDTAEEYNDGGSESFLGNVITKQQRSNLIISTKFLPTNASRLEQACAASLKRLNTDYIDLYMLHGYEDGIDLHDMINSLDRLVALGMIRRWGVSNCNADVIRSILDLSTNCYMNQILYAPNARDYEKSLRQLHNNAGIGTMAHSILKGINRQQPWIGDHAYTDYCTEHGIDPVSLAIAWVCRDGNTIPVISTTNIEHLKFNIMEMHYDKHFEIFDRLYPVK